MFIVSVSNPNKNCGSVYYASSVDLVPSSCVHPSEGDLKMMDCLEVAERDGCDRILIIDIHCDSRRCISVGSDVKIYVMDEKGSTVAKFE